MKRGVTLSLTKGQGEEPGLYSSSKEPQSVCGGGRVIWGTSFQRTGAAIDKMHFQRPFR